MITNAIQHLHPGPETPEPDRLAHLKKYSDELNEIRLWKIRASYQKRWTKYRRTQKSLEIRMVKPWSRATGPKNCKPKCSLYERLFAVMRDQRCFIRETMQVMGMTESRKPRTKTPRACLEEGREITKRFTAINAEFSVMLQRDNLCNTAQ